MKEYDKLVKALRFCFTPAGKGCGYCPAYKSEKTGCCRIGLDAAEAIEALQAEVKRLQEKLCDWCAVCPKESRKPEDCELLSETPVMYGPSEAKMEVQE